MPAVISTATADYASAIAVYGGLSDPSLTSYSLFVSAIFNISSVR